MWQLDLSPDYMRDTGAVRAGFKVILLHAVTHGALVWRVWQLPPFAPRLARHGTGNNNEISTGGPPR